MNKLLITQNKIESKLLIEVIGELDASSCIPAEKEFEKALNADATSIYVDCRQLTYISSAGIGVLISLHHACQQKKIPLYFCEVQSKVKNVFEILGLDRLFTMQPSLEKALEAAPAIKS